MGGNTALDADLTVIYHIFLPSPILALGTASSDGWQAQRPGEETKRQGEHAPDVHSTHSWVLASLVPRWDALEAEGVYRLTLICSISERGQRMKNREGFGWGAW